MKLFYIVIQAYKDFFQHLMHGKDADQHYLMSNHTLLLHSDHDDELI
ncbi:unnamed protein product, partial [Brachionus calyciflorus]